jgi:hypothetical protein
LNTEGKVIISSLEMNSTNNQYIHWQRCTGRRINASAYGVWGAVVTGLGPTGNQVTATSDVAVMFVEVWYQQKGLFGSMFVKPMTLHQEAAYMVRDTRNLTAGLSGQRPPLLSDGGSINSGGMMMLCVSSPRNAAHQQVDHMLRP